MQLIKFLLSVSRLRIAAVVVAGLVCGAANTYLLILIRGVVSPEPPPGNTLLNFALTGLVVLVSGVVGQVLLIRLAQDAIYRLRAELSSGVVSAPLEHLERLGTHRLIATLTEDVRALSEAATAIPSICVDVATIVGCFVFLAVVSGPVFAITVAGTLVSIFCVEAFLTRVRTIYHEARENEDVLLRSFQAVTLGIKELKLHRGRRQDFMDRHLLGTAHSLREQNADAGAKFSIAQGLGQLFQIVTMALILFVIAAALHLPPDVMVAYVLIATFLSMPMQNFMHRIPDLLRGDVALKKIRGMELSMETMHNECQLPYTDRPAAGEARLDLVDVSYNYQMHTPPTFPAGPGGRPEGPPIGPPPDDGSGFALGPISLTFEPGQITFIVGGNGSGKSTLAKLITGLYVPRSGSLALNGETVDHDNIEWYRQNTSAIFTDFHLFEDYLGFDRTDIDDEVRHYLEELQLAHKVTVHDGKLSTIALSQGQRKRLALLTALLEDRQIYLFDEWAADQEPRFREVFYKEILVDLKRRGKTVIVITHDDRYFDSADQLVKLEYGRVSEVTRRAEAPALRTA